MTLNLKQKEADIVWTVLKYCLDVMPEPEALGSSYDQEAWDANVAAAEAVMEKVERAGSERWDSTLKGMAGFSQDEAI